MPARPNVPLERFKYKMSDVILTANGFEEPITIRKSFVRSLSIINDYDNTISPRMQLVFQADIESYKKIITNMNTLTATFTIYKTNIGQIIDSSEVESSDEIEQDHIWQSVTLKALNDDNINTADITQMTSDEEYVDDTVDNSQKTALVTLLLYDNIQINKYRKNEYYILNGSKNDLLYNMFKDREFNNILMTPTDNTQKTYKIPYGHMGNNLDMLNLYYGIYDNPYLFFMDLDCIYLLDKGNVGNTLRANELKCVSIYLEKRSTTGYVSDGSYTDTENNMYILNTGDFSISDNDSVIDYAFGGNIKTIISTTGEIKTDKIGDYDVERAVIVDNPKHHSQLIYTTKEQKRNVILQFKNIDISIITPNKRYTIFPDETFYNNSYNIKGDYRLSKVLLILKRTNEDEFNSSIQISLNKIS